MLNNCSTLLIGTNKQRVLSLYRKIFRAAKLFPTKSRQDFVKDRLREQYCLNLNQTKQEEIDSSIVFAETQLEQIEHLGKHLQKTFADELVHARF
jgi:hypothetical protein